MNSENSNTDIRILEAAKQVFHLKGYEGARMQEIADAAGVNKALVHYYYRNKDTLFLKVFEDAFIKLMARVSEIFGSDLSFGQKVELFLDYYVDFLSNNSYLPIFILHGLYTRPDKLRALLQKINPQPLRITEQIRDQVKSELNLEIDPMHVFIDILSLCIFPVVARPMIENIFGFGIADIRSFYSERKDHVPEFILNAFLGYQTKASRHE